MPHVYVLHLLIHTCNVSVDRCRLQHMQCFYLYGWINSADLYQCIHTPNIIIGKHFRMWDICLGAWGEGGLVRVGGAKGNL